MDIELRYIKKIASQAASQRNHILLHNPSKITIGREPTCHITLDPEESAISRHHAVISKVNNSFYITDTSISGTFLNKARQAIGNGNSASIVHNDIIRLGHYYIKFIVKTTSTIASTPPVQSSHGLKQTQVNPMYGGATEKFPSYKPQAPKASTAVSPPENLKEQIDQPSADSELLKHFLKGLGVENSSTELSPEQMLTLGRCLRGSLSGVIKQRNHAEQIKETLCFGNQKLLKQLNYSSLAGFQTADDFIQEILSDNNKKYTKFPLEVVNCQKEITEDHANIYKSFNKAIDSFREELSPFAIEKLYQTNNKNLSGKLVPSIGKWEAYKRQWGEKCISFKHIIQRHFEDNIQKSHQQRINKRQLIKKK